MQRDSTENDSAVVLASPNRAALSPISEAALQLRQVAIAARDLVESSEFLLYRTVPPDHPLATLHHKAN